MKLLPNWLLTADCSEFSALDCRVEFAREQTRAIFLVRVVVWAN